jgi:hypothetical protein
MAFPLRLDDARSDLTNLAAIDGKTGANGRHSPTNLNRLLNRKYRLMRSRVSQLGLPQFLQSTAALTLPAATAGEDFIEIPMNALTSEVVGVDVLVGANPHGWGRLDPLEFEQRRDVGNTFVNYGYAQGMQPPSGIGFWAINKAASVVNTTTITVGTIALWPTRLSGQYKLHSVESWTDISTDANVFLLYEGWDEWFLNAAAMTICQRDKNKTDQYAQARDAFNTADALIVASAARLQRGGYTTPTPYGGIIL